MAVVWPCWAMPDRASIPFVIIGGGASGLAAAITAARLLKPRRIGPVVVLERLDRVGKKLLATGNGRCNLTNTDTGLERYHGRDTRFAMGALKRMDSESTIHFFRELGMLCRTEEDGRVFPYSLQANTVLDTLRQAATDLDVELRTGFDVSTIQPTQPLFIGNNPLNVASGFDLFSEKGEHLHATKVLVAAGGCASPALGSNGSGFRLLTELGHEWVEPLPAIVQITTETTLTRPLTGIKVQGRARLYENQSEIATEDGEILFTEYGLSGPPILNLARLVSERIAKTPMHIVLDLMPEYDEPALSTLLAEFAGASSSLTVADCLNGLLHKKLAQIVVRQALDRSLTDLARTLTREDRRLLAAMVKNLPFKVTGTRGFAFAQTTAGGIATAGFRPDTLESRTVPGLYAAGEVLDIDGDCGGFNLQWAWSSGCLAGRKAAETLIREATDGGRHADMEKQFRSAIKGRRNDPDPGGPRSKRRP